MRQLISNLFYNLVDSILIVGSLILQYSLGIHDCYGFVADFLLYCRPFIIIR